MTQSDIPSEPPSEFIVPKRITVTQECFERIVELLEKPREPTEALQRLLQTTD
ncbi:MAG: DUF1778 domain-containing protein [Myxococcota bacterium]